MIKFLWYLTITSSIWITYFGSISTSFGEIYPFQILVLVMLLPVINKKRIKTNKTIVFTVVLFAILFMYGLFSLIWSVDFSISISKLVQYFFGILFLYEFMILVDTSEKLKKSITVISFNYLAVLTVAIFEIITGTYFYATHYKQTIHLNSFGFNFPLVMLNNTNDLAVFIFLFFPLTIYTLSSIKKGNKIISLLIYSAIVFVLFNTESRLASALIIMYGLIGLLLHFIEHARNKNPLYFSLSVGSILLASILYLFDFQIFRTIIEAVIHDPRIIIYKSAFNAFLKTLTFGLGIGGVYHIGYLGIMNVHNYILEVLLEFGLLIFIVFSVWLIHLYNKVNKAIARASIRERFILSFHKLNILLIFVWGSISSTITSRPHIWLFYGILVLSTFLLLKDDAVNKHSLLNE